MIKFKNWLVSEGKTPTWGDSWGQMMHDREQAKFPKPSLTPGTSSNQIKAKDLERATKNPKSDLANSLKTQNKNK